MRTRQNRLEASFRLQQVLQNLYIMLSKFRQYELKLFSNRLVIFSLFTKCCLCLLLFLTPTQASSSCFFFGSLSFVEKDLLRREWDVNFWWILRNGYGFWWWWDANSWWILRNGYGFVVNFFLRLGCGLALPVIFSGF
jgi:hypothetical protein